MKDPIETIEYKGYKINVAEDYDPMNPRENDNLGKMLAWHSRYNLGDREETDAIAEIPEDFSSRVEFGEFIKEKFKAVAILPLFLYDHSGITMKTSSYNDQFDSMWVGFIIATEADVLKEYGKTDTKTMDLVHSVLKGEVVDYDKYISGQAEGFIVEDREGNEVDSCWGYFEREALLEDAKSSIDYEVKNAPKAKDKSILGRAHV